MKSKTLEEEHKTNVRDSIKQTRNIFEKLFTINNVTREHSVVEEEIQEDSSTLLLSELETIDIKKKLNWLGYAGIKETGETGKFAIKRIKEFQADHGLEPNGLLGYLTISKINEVFVSTFKEGSTHYKIKKIKENLNRLGFAGIEVTPNYGPFLTKRVMEFQEFYGLVATGRIDLETIDKMEELLTNPLQVNHQHEAVWTLKENLIELGYRVNLSNKFGKLTERTLKRFQKDYGLPINGIADEVTLDKINYVLRYREKLIHIKYDLTLEEAVEIQVNEYPHLTKVELESLLNPNHYLKDEKKKFLFLDITKPNVTDVDSLNQFLAKQGILENHGQTFIDVGNEYGINELFLLAFLMNTNTEEQITGSPTDVITSAARNINEKYVSQNTFYNMFWNPAYMNFHKKAHNTVLDHSFVESLLYKMYSICIQLNTYKIYLEVPVYKNN